MIFVKVLGPNSPILIRRLTARSEFPILQKSVPAQLLRTPSNRRAPVAQLDRAMAYEAIGYRFDSCRVYLKDKDLWKVMSE